MEAAHDCPAVTWSTSLLINCGDEAEFDALFVSLAEGGTVMMKDENFMHFRKVAWITDKFGITWQPVLQRFEVFDMTFFELAKSRFSVRSYTTSEANIINHLYMLTNPC